MTGEFSALARLMARLPPPRVGEVGIGDDTAVLDPRPGQLLLAADAVVEGVHADLGLTGLDDLGWKALAANVSDVAAMGGRPGHAVVTVAGPGDTDLDLLYEGLAAAARHWDCPIVGGDLTNAPTLVVSVAVTGWVEGPPVLRSGAGPDEEIWVTGPLGAAAAGLRRLRSGAPFDPDDAAMSAHARPSPVVSAGPVAKAAGATAMIDVSDGFTADLGHLADDSEVGYALTGVPVAPGATVDEALGGGEDYELVFTAPPGAPVRTAFAAVGLRPPARVGRTIADATVRTLDGHPVSATGWQHDWGDPDPS